MADMGIIEECESPYSASAVLVPNKNSDYRVYIDYRRFNEVTIPDQHQLPRIDDLLNTATQTAFMTTSWPSIWLLASSRVRQRQNRFCVFFWFIPFQSHAVRVSTPDTFQRLLDGFCNRLLDVVILTYLDDINILSPSFEKHLKDLDCVFARVKLFKIKCYSRKVYVCHKNC